MTDAERRARALLLAPAALLLGGFFFVPLLAVAVCSLLTPGVYGGVEWAFYPWNYGRLLGWADRVAEVFEPIYLLVIGRSLLLAAATVIVCLLLCYPVAFWIAGLPARRRGPVLFLVTLPFFASLIVRLYAWLLILKPSGVLALAFGAIGLGGVGPQLLYTPAAVVLGMVYVYVPFMILPLYASVEGLDRALVEASGDLGATPRQTLAKVVLPQTLPGAAAGSVMVFFPAVGNFIVPNVLGGAKGLMAGNLVEQQFLASRNWPFGSALAIVIMALVAAILAAFRSRLGGGALGR